MAFHINTSSKRGFTPRTTFRTDRIEVTCYGPGDYALAVDGELIGFYRSSAEAEHAAAMRIEEEARMIAAGAKRAA